MVLNDVTNVDLSTSVLGSKLAFPVCVAAVGVNRMAHNDKELAVARGTVELIL